jgi:hypothetical protein
LAAAGGCRASAGGPGAAGGGGRRRRAAAMPHGTPRYLPAAERGGLAVEADVGFGFGGGERWRR